MSHKVTYSTPPTFSDYITINNAEIKVCLSNARKKWKVWKDYLAIKFHKIILISQVDYVYNTFHAIL